MRTSLIFVIVFFALVVAPVFGQDYERSATTVNDSSTTGSSSWIIGDFGSGDNTKSDASLTGLMAVEVNSAANTGTSQAGSRNAADVDRLKADERDASWRLRFAWTPTYYDVSKLKSVSIPVHPDDSGFLRGNTDVSADSDVDWFSFTIGVEKAFRIKSWEGHDWSIRPTIGFDGQFSFLSLDTDSPDRSLQEVRQQSSDTRPASQGSFVYDRLSPGIFTPIAFVGLEVNYGKWVISPEVGVAYRQFQREFGHSRYGNFFSIGESDEWALSPRVALRIGCHTSEDTEVGLFAAYESYNYDFGDVTAITCGLNFMIRF